MSETSTLNREQKYTAISIFSGGLGLDIGVEQTERFRLLACLDSDHDSCSTARINRNAGRFAKAGLKIYETGIEDVDPEKILAECGLKPGELDLLVGGPPCQSFSTAGRRATVSHPTGLLVWQFLRFVQVMRPKFFIMENVRGLLSSAMLHRPIRQRPPSGGPPLLPEEKPGSVIQLLSDDYRILEPTPYRFDCFEVNAVNYGAPQLRERVIIIGNRLGRISEFPEPSHGAICDNADLVEPLSSDFCLLPFRTLGDAIEGIHEDHPVIMDFSPRKKRYLASVPPGGNWRSLPEELQRESMGEAWNAKGGRSGWWRRLTYDLPSPTIVTMPNHSGTALCHPDEVRALTVKECALIQEFPADWEFTGTAQSQYRQVGNAVPVGLGSIAAGVVARELDSAEGQMFSTQPDVLAPSRIVYVASHVRTRKWYKNGQPVVWDGRNKNRLGPPKTLRAVRILG